MQKSKLYIGYGFIASNLFAYLMILLTRELLLKRNLLKGGGGNYAICFNCFMADCHHIIII
jgi:hypothetical protein